ncbi:MAG: hypothetical protein QM786_16205 [Breznakibacter sp.]
MYKQSLKIVVLLTISVLITAFSIHVGIFWDNVLFVSKMGNHLYQSHPFGLRVPDAFDPGHPPFIAVLMSMSWDFFGKSLSVSHWLMFPFVFGLLWQLYSLIMQFIPNEKDRVWAFLLVLADPSLLSQLIQVTPETIQLFFFFGALNGYLRENSLSKTFFLAMLGIVSYRGMMMCLGILMIEVVDFFFIKKGKLKQFVTTRLFFEYFIGALPAGLYVVWRLATKGWITSNPLEVWGNAWDFDGPADFFLNLLRNSVVLIHRFMDFGRLTILVFIGVVLITKRKQIDWNKHARPIIIFLFSTFVVYATSLMIKNTMGHRYYIASYLVISLLAFMFLEYVKNRKLFFSLMFFSLIGGNFIVYPDKIAQGWDSSLAHLPYWKLRKEAIGYIDHHSVIPIDSTASFFPNITSIDNVDMDGDLRQFIPFTGNEKQVFYSNVYNLSDKEFEILDAGYVKDTVFERCQVRIVVYRKKQ